MWNTIEDKMNLLGARKMTQRDLRVAAKAALAAGDAALAQKLRELHDTRLKIKYA